MLNTFCNTICSLQVYSTIYVTTPQKESEETPQSRTENVEFDLERMGKLGFACWGTYCPLRNSATPRRDWWMMGKYWQWIYLWQASVYKWWTLYILIVFHSLNPFPVLLKHFPQVPACAEINPMTLCFRIIDDTLLLSGLRHPVDSDSVSAF